MSLHRLRITSVGGTIGTGYTSIYFGAMTLANLSAVNTFFNAIKSLIPLQITYTIPSSGDQIDETTGKLTGGWSMGSPTSITGSGTYTAGLAGFLCQLKTSAVIDGHRPEGKIIIVPAAQGAFNNTTGGISSVCQSTANPAITALISSTAGLAIWHRPVYDRTVKPPVLKRLGGSVAVETGQVGPLPTVLRSRRK